MFLGENVMKLKDDKHVSIVYWQVHLQIFVDVWYSQRYTSTFISSTNSRSIILQKLKQKEQHLKKVLPFYVFMDVFNNNFI